MCFISVFRYRERLHVLLEEERRQHQKSWKVGLSALEEQQQQLLEAHRRTTEVLKETDTFAFINRCDYDKCDYQLKNYNYIYKTTHPP